MRKENAGKSRGLEKDYDAVARTLQDAAVDGKFFLFAGCTYRDGAGLESGYKGLVVRQYRYLARRGRQRHRDRSAIEACLAHRGNDEMEGIHSA